MSLQSPNNIDYTIQISNWEPSSLIKMIQVCLRNSINSPWNTCFTPWWIIKRYSGNEHIPLLPRHTAGNSLNDANMLQESLKWGAWKVLLMELLQTVLNQWFRPQIYIPPKFPQSAKPGVMILYPSKKDLFWYLYVTVFQKLVIGQSAHTISGSFGRSFSAQIVNKLQGKWLYLNKEIVRIEKIFNWVSLHLYAKKSETVIV